MRKSIKTKVIKRKVKPLKNPCPTCEEKADCKKGFITCCLTYMQYETMKLGGLK